MIKQRGATPSTLSLPERKKKAILSLDWGDRVKNIAAIWPAFPALVVRRFNYLWETSKVMKKRSRSRHRAAYSRVCKKLPETPMLPWEEELFESVFHEILDGIDDHFTGNAEWTPGVRSEIGSQVLPRLHLHVANWHSRSTRPSLPMPKDQQEGTETATPVEDSDEYPGWFRCGYFERQLLVPSMFSCNGVLTVMAGLEFPHEAGVFDHTQIPLAMGNADAWWAHYDTLPIQPKGFVGYAVGLDIMSDWMGKTAVLALQPSIAACLNLRAPASWQRPLALTDPSGENAIVFRSWSVRPVGDAIDAENRMLEGCDLLMRSDMFERMKQLRSYPPSIIRWIRRTGV